MTECMECIFCLIASGKIPSEKIWEDEQLFAFLDINPINPGHTLIIPKKHAKNVFEIDEPVYTGLFSAAKKLSSPIQKATGARRIGMIVEGFLVQHAHLHLVPLHNGGELDFKLAKKAPPGELSNMAQRIRDEI